MLGADVDLEAYPDSSSRTMRSLCNRLRVWDVV